MLAFRAIVFCLVAQACAIELTGLRVESLAESDAIGIDVTTPRFAWAVANDGLPRGIQQSTYHISVKSDQGTVMWDTTAPAPQKYYLIPYLGAPLASATRYSWSVTVKLSNGLQATGNSTFMTGVIGAAAWLGGDWIGGSGENQVLANFSVPADKTVSYAIAHVASPGGAVLHLNGQVYGSDAGYAAWVSPQISNVYHAVDVTAGIQSGDNAIGFLLGRCFSTKPALKLRLDVIFTDFTRVTVVSGGQEPLPPKAMGQCGVINENSAGEFNCPAGQVITGVKFASFGTPTGSCTGIGNSNNFAINPKCNAPATPTVVNHTCFGSPSCVLHADRAVFGSDPCRMVKKHLSVAVNCGAAPSPAPPPPPSAPTVRAQFKARQSHILLDDPWIGTTNDWRLYLSGWDKPGFDASSWKTASKLSTYDGTTLRSIMAKPTTVYQTYTAAKPFAKTAEGDMVYDLKQNLVGTCEIGVPAGSPAGSSLTLVHGEVFNGTLYGMYKGQADTHIFAEGQTGSVKPTFTWHGFQFVVVKNNGTKFDGGPLTCKFMHSGLDQTGSLSFVDDDKSNNTGALLNSIHNIVLNSQRGNLAAWLPTDCPTREKHGWLGDAQVTAEEAMFNFEMSPIYRHYLQLLTDDQNAQGDLPGAAPGSAGGRVTDISWTAAYPLIASWLWEHYTDTGPASDHIKSLEKFVNFLHDQAVAKKRPHDIADFFIWGDWCAVESRALATPTTGPELAAFNYILSLDAMATMCDAIQSSCAANFSTLAQKARPNFFTLYHNTSTNLFGPSALDVQTLTAAPLALGNTIPESSLEGVLTALGKSVDSFSDHLTYGSVGAKHVLHQLSSNGMHERAVKIATQTDFPSFGHWIANGATTCWENWSGVADPSHPPEPTHNHIFLCAGADEWMYRDMLGFRLTKPGGAALTIAPRVLGDIGPGGAQGYLKTPRGEVQVSWQRTPAGSGVSLNVTLPVGDASTVIMPLLDHSASDFVVTESGTTVWQDGKFKSGVTGVSAAEATNEGIAFTVSSGAYEFKSTSS